VSRKIVVSTLQLPQKTEGESAEEKKRGNLKAIVEDLTVAGERGSDVSVFGEMANLHGLPFKRESLAEYADPVPGPFLDSISEIAEEYSMNIIAPAIARIEGALRNAALVVDRQGELVGSYLKTHLPAPEAEAGIVPGDEIPVFELDFGKVGIMICMDIEYPEVPLCLMLRGAEVIFFPHVQSGWGEIDWEARYRSRAIDTGTYLVSSSYGVGDEEPWRPGMMLGRSGIIGPDGMILAEASRYVEVLTREIDLDRKRISNFHFARLCERSTAVKASRRPELYGILCDTDTVRESEARAQEIMKRLEDGN
jgi:predicted amidohydrolase